jgi:hypothetical protein
VHAEVLGARSAAAACAQPGEKTISETLPAAEFPALIGQRSRKGIDLLRFSPNQLKSAITESVLVAAIFDQKQQNSW